MVRIGADGRMVIGRREMLAGLVVVAGAAVGPGRSLLPWFSETQPFTRTAVAERIGESFRVIGGVNDGARLAITSIAELPGRAATVLDDQFAVRFTAPTGLALPSDMYWFATRSFGRLPLYVSPLVDRAGRTDGFEALVNRYVSPDAGPLSLETAGRS